MSEKSEKLKTEISRYLDQTDKGESPRVLPTFEGYTVDFRLDEFRKANFPSPIEFVPFNSRKGQQLLASMVKTLKKQRKT